MTNHAHAPSTGTPGSLVAAALSAMLAGCALPPPAPIVHQPMTTRAPAPAPQAGDSGAIFDVRYGNRPLFEDRRARNIGDTLVVLITESTAANKKASSSVERTGSTNIGVTALSGLPGTAVAGALGVTTGGNVAGTSANTFDGGGEASSVNTFTGTIAVTVIEVLPNGNLLVSGEKQIAMSVGTEYVRFSGLVNPRSISITNSVPSSQIADARIEYKANGYIDQAQVMGWLSRFFLSASPF